AGRSRSRASDRRRAVARGDARVVRRAIRPVGSRRGREDPHLHREGAEGRSCVVISLPFNDLRCLGSITEVIAELVKNEDTVIAEIAAKHPTTDSLAAWIRTLPQRDDDGDKKDGPKVDAC